MPSFHISLPVGSRRARAMLAACLAGALLLSPRIAMAQADDVFGDIAGSWHGGGRVTGTDGKDERIRCTARYSVSPSGNNLSQALVCASDSYRFNIRSNLVASGNHVEGTWAETTRNAEGHLSGEVQGNSVVTSVAGPGFTAQLSVVTTGRKQVLSIVPQGTNVANVEIVLTR